VAIGRTGRKQPSNMHLARAYEERDAAHEQAISTRRIIAGLQSPRHQMRALVGIDLQPVDEVEASLRIFGSRYGRRLFTEQELKTSGNDSLTAPRLAACFAAKEAVLKLLDTREMMPPWASIEVTDFLGASPQIVLHDSAAELGNCQGLKDLSVSLSYSGEIAVATATANVDFEPGEGLL
jgi:holo-[acyl-carrier protein] synthase